MENRRHGSNCVFRGNKSANFDVMLLFAKDCWKIVRFELSIADETHYETSRTNQKMVEVLLLDSHWRLCLHLVSVGCGSDLLSGLFAETCCWSVGCSVFDRVSRIAFPNERQKVMAATYRCFCGSRLSVDVVSSPLAQS